MPFWVAQTEANREAVAARFLGLAGYSTYLPRIAQRRAVRPLFPSYLFIERVDQWWTARWSIGVVRLVAHCREGEPTTVPDAVVNDLRRREPDGVIVLPARPDFEPGAAVVIRRGVFAGQHAFFEGMRGRDRVAILLAVLGRVELPRKDVAAR